MKQANITKTNKIKDTVYRKIQEDYDLRIKIARDVQMRENALYLAALRNAKRIEHYFIIEAFKKHSGWDDDQIFNTPKAIS